MGGIPPPLRPFPEGLCAPPPIGSYKSLSHRPCISTRIMLLIEPVTVFSFAFFWVAILLHTQVTHLHHDGPQGVQQRLLARQVRRIVGPPRKHAHRIRLVVRMQARPVDQESDAPVDRPPRGREAATAVRIRVYHVRPKSGDLPLPWASYKAPSSTCANNHRTIIPAPTRISRTWWTTCSCRKTGSTRYETTSAPASDTSTQPHHHHHEFGSTCPPVPSSEDQSQLGTPHTRRVGHTFPLVKLGFKCNKPELKPVPKNVYFFPFFEFPREYPRDCPGGPRPSPSLGLGSGPRGTP